MCLLRIATEAEKNEILSKLPEEFTVYKLVEGFAGNYFPPSCSKWVRYKKGINNADEHIQIKADDNQMYTSGFHFIQNKSYVKKWAEKLDRLYSKNYLAIPMKIRKEWIKTVGFENIGQKGKIVEGVVFVTKALYLENDEYVLPGGKTMAHPIAETIHVTKDGVSPVSIHKGKD